MTLPLRLFTEGERLVIASCLRNAAAQEQDRALTAATLSAAIGEDERSSVETLATKVRACDAYIAKLNALAEVIERYSTGYKGILIPEQF